MPKKNVLTPLCSSIGDAVDGFLAVMVMNTCMSIDGGLPASLKAKMVLNIIFDLAIGMVPLLGDLADAMFLANSRNVALVEEHLRQQGPHLHMTTRLTGPAEP